MFCVLEKNVCSDPVAESVLHMSLRFSWSIVFLKSCFLIDLLSGGSIHC